MCEAGALAALLRNILRTLTLIRCAIYIFSIPIKRAHRRDREKVDREADRPEHEYVMINLWRNRLGATTADNDIEFGTRPRGKTQLAVVHDDPAPFSRSNLVCSLEPRWHRLFVPFRARSHESQIVGQFGPITERTLEWGAESGVTAMGI